jgi:hypothetical protein
MQGFRDWGTAIAYSFGVRTITNLVVRDGAFSASRP